MMIIIGLWPSQVGRRLGLLSRATMASNEMGLRVDGRRGQWSRRPALKISGIFSRQESRTFLASLRGSHTGSVHICTRRRLLYWIPGRHAASSLLCLSLQGGNPFLKSLLFFFINLLKKIYFRLPCPSRVLLRLCAFSGPHFWCKGATSISCRLQLTCHSKFPQIFLASISRTNCWLHCIGLPMLELYYYVLLFAVCI